MHITFYLRVKSSYENAEISDESDTVGPVENIMDSKNQDGTFMALVQFTTSIDKEEYYRYMNYKIREDSDYSFVSIGMIPMGQSY